MMNIQQALDWADRNSAPEAVERLRSRAVAKVLSNEVRELVDLLDAAHRFIGSIATTEGLNEIEETLMYQIGDKLNEYEYL